jgi:hypothetical protein
MCLAPVFMTHSGFYAGSVVLELAPTRRKDAGLRCVLVKGAWKDCEVTGGDGAFFYLLATPDQCSVTACAVPAQWIIDEHCHNQVDITFCGTTITIDPPTPANQFAAWVIKHIVVEQNAQEMRRIEDKARCCWGCRRTLGLPDHLRQSLLGCTHLILNFIGSCEACRRRWKPQEAPRRLRMLPELC